MDSSFCYGALPSVGAVMPISKAAAVLSSSYPSSRTSKTRKGRLEEEIETAHHLIFFSPEFHCELVNFIERFWCEAKWYAREHCEYSLDGLGKVLSAVPSSLTSTGVATTVRESWVPTLRGPNTAPRHPQSAHTKAAAGRPIRVNGGVCESQGLGQGGGAEGYQEGDSGG